MSSETVCFACGRSAGSISRPTYAKEIELFKKFVLDLGPSYKRKHELGDTVVAEFGASSHLCATCLSSVVAVWRMQEKIVSIQKEINCIVRKVRNHLEIKTEEREGVVEEECDSWSFLQLGADSGDEQIHDGDDAMIDVKYDVHVGRAPDETDFESRPPKRSKAFQLLPNNEEVKSEPDSDSDNYEMNLYSLQSRNSNEDSTNGSTRPDSTKRRKPGRISTQSLHEILANRENPEDEIPINAIDPTRNHSKLVCCLKPNCNKSWHPDVARHITLHAVKEKWTDFIRTQKGDMSWTPTKNTKICSLHFYCTMFRMSNGRQEIEEWAMPMETKNSVPPNRLLPPAQPSNSNFPPGNSTLTNEADNFETDDLFLSPPPRNITPEPPLEGATSPPTWLPIKPNSRSCLSEEHCYSAPPRDEKLEKVQAELEDWKKNYRSLARKLERRNKTNAMLKEQIRE